MAGPQGYEFAYAPVQRAEDGEQPTAASQEDAESLEQRTVGSSFLPLQPPVSPLLRVVALGLAVVVSLFALLSVLSADDRRAIDREPESLSPVIATHAEREAAFILTGEPELAASLSPRSLQRLRRALEGVALTVLSLRPSLQRELWFGDCAAYLPCPSPNSHVRQLRPTGVEDREVFEMQLNRSDGWLSRWTRAWSRPPSPSPLFHAAAAAESRRPFAPGESAEDQEVALRFQSELHALQHPHNCSDARVMILDHYHSGGGFGSWSHSRAVALAVGFRAGRTVIEGEGMGGYPIAWSDCTRLKGMGGCDLFLPASSCPFPSDWRDLLERDRAEWRQTHQEPALSLPLQQQLEHLRERRIIASTELRNLERLELHHLPRPGWEMEQLSQLPGPLAYLRAMPECWWSRQALSYHFRPTREASLKLLALVAQSLQLPEPTVTAANAHRYADSLAPALTHTVHWWSCIQAVKLEWQLQQLSPAITSALRREAKGEPWREDGDADSSTAQNVVPSPLLGYMFIRHGDKANEGVTHADAEYLGIAERLARDRGLTGWYVGADDLLSPNSLRETTASSHSPLSLYTSALVDSIEDKQRHPLASGFVWDRATSLTDEDRAGIAWRTALEFAVAQVADLFLSTWTSNHPRMAYELGTALSDARAMAPFIGLDYEVEDGTHTRLKQSKRGLVEHCS